MVLAMKEKKRGIGVSESRKEKKKRRLILSDSEEEEDAFLTSSRSNGGNHAEVEAKSNLGSEVVMQTKAESMEKSDKAAEVRATVEAESKEKAEKAVEVCENVEKIAEVEMKEKAVDVREIGEKIEEVDKAEKVAGDRENAEKIEEVESKEKAVEVCEKVEMIGEIGSQKVRDGSFDKKENSEEDMEVDAEVVAKNHEGTDRIKKVKDDSAVRSHGSIIKKGSRKGEVKVDVKKVAESIVKEKEGVIVKKRSSEEEVTGEVKKVLKLNVKKKEGVESIVKKRSSEKESKVEVKKVLKPKVGKEKERVESCKSFSKKKNSKGEKTLEEKKGLKLTPLKRREVVESVKRTVELGSSRKRNREALGDDEDDPSLKRLRSLRSSHEKSSTMEINGNNMISDSSVSLDKIHNVKVDRERQMDDSREKDSLMKKNLEDSEKVKCNDESTARTLRKMKDRALSGSDRREEVGISPLKSIKVQSRSGVLRVLPSNKDVGRSKGVHIPREEEEDGAADHPSHSKQEKGEKPISTAKSGKNIMTSKQVSLTETEKSKSPKVKQKNMDSSNVKTNSPADEDTSQKRSTMKQKIRDDIRDILFEAGWKLDLRPRKGRAYEDAVYVPPSGKGSYWSITKAYAIYVEDCKKSKLSTFATIPSERIRMLTRNVVNKRRSSAEMKEAKKKLGGKKKGKEFLKTKESKKNSDGVGSTAHKRHLKGRNKKRRGCKLLVRGANKDAEADEDDDYVPYVGKRTILSWMIDLGIMRADGKVNYMNKSHSRALLEGSITRDGIRCSCCSKTISVAKFEIHAGSKRRQPYQNIFVVEAGMSLLQCQLKAWEKQQNPARQAFIKLDIDGDDPNDDTCGICGDGGDLICCDGCPSTFHLNCMGIQMLPPDDWHCTNCSCRYCGSVSDAVLKESASTIPKLLTCSQCDKKYHQECTPEVDAISVCSSKSNNSFCGQSCKKIFGQLQKLIGTKNDLEAGLSWSIVRCFHGESSGSLCNLPQKAECNSKIAVAYAVMDECFCPIIDDRSGINLIHNVVHNCGSNFSRLSYTGFYTFLLERGDEVICVASVRIHGTRLAEMPFIGTRSMYRRQGMCRQLLNGIESALYSLGVEKLIIPAIAELVETWTNIFGFKPLELSQKKEVKSINIMVFPGTGLLQKPILKDSNGAELGRLAQHKRCGLAGDVVPPENVIGEQLIIQTNENSDVVSPPGCEFQTLHCNSSKTASNVDLSIQPTKVDQNEFKDEGKLNAVSSDELNIKIPSVNSLQGNPEPENAASTVESENQLNSNSNSKIEVPFESIILDTREAIGRNATVASSLDALHAISVEYANEDGYTCQEAAKEVHTDGLLVNGDSNVVIECKPPCNKSYALQVSDTNHHHSSGKISELTLASIVEHDSCAAGQHVVDCNHGVEHAIQGADEVVADVCIKRGRCAEGMLDTKLIEDDLAGVTPVVSFGLSFLCSTSNAVVESSN